MKYLLLIIACGLLFTALGFAIAGVQLEGARRCRRSRRDGEDMPEQCCAIASLAAWNVGGRPLLPITTGDPDVADLLLAFGFRVTISAGYLKGCDAASIDELEREMMQDPYYDKFRAGSGREASK